MKTTIIFYIILATMMTLPAGDVAGQQQEKKLFNWKVLQPIPDKFGFAGSFAGVSHHVLLVAGGANFPDGGTPWTGSKKVWHDSVFALSEPDGRWKVAGRLPFPLGYGVSVSWKNRLICVGGSNADGHHAKVFQLEYKDDSLLTSFLPDLPAPLANACGALIGDVLYITGGIESPEAKTAGSNFWCLDLSERAMKWKQMDAWPGEGRMLAVAGSQDGCFYLMGGTALVKGSRRYLKDAYRYCPGKGWQQIPNLPGNTVAAPTPAYNGLAHCLMIFGGDDGQLADQATTLKEKHPGFSKEIVCFNSGTNKWTIADEMITDKRADASLHPNNSIWPPVTTPFVEWKGRLVFPGGEVRPAVRTPNVLAARVR